MHGRNPNNETTCGTRTFRSYEAPAKQGEEGQPESFQEHWANRVNLTLRDVNLGPSPSFVGSRRPSWKRCATHRFHSGGMPSTPTAHDVSEDCPGVDVFPSAPAWRGHESSRPVRIPSPLRKLQVKNRVC